MIESDLNAEIDREFEIARARWGDTFELKCLEGSRGDTLSDEELLEALRYFAERGTAYERIICARTSPSETKGTTIS